MYTQLEKSTTVSVQNGPQHLKVPYVSLSEPFMA